MGIYVSSAGRGNVQVRIDSTNEIVEARLTGFAQDYVLEPGDEIGVEYVEGGWQTIPNVKYVVHHESRIEFWTINRQSGALRLLAESFYE